MKFIQKLAKPLSIINPLLFAFLAGASGIRLFDTVTLLGWVTLEVATLGFFVVFALFMAAVFQWALATKTC